VGIDPRATVRIAVDKFIHSMGNSE